MSRRSFFEHFELIEPIGRGAMGAIWRARHRGEGEEVAVKVLGTSNAARDTIQAAFGDEVRAVASLRHPGIIDVYDYGELLVDDPLPPHPDLRVGSPYLVMELADGGNLEELVDAMSWSQIRALLLGLLDALAHAHARDLVHRDIKPANILRFGQGEHARFKLADFGIAHAIASPAEASGEHNASGTPLYMAPEQFTDQRRDFGPWTDLYALGCVAFELLSGRPPFDARSFIGLYDQHSNAPIPRPDLPEGAIPEGLQGWLERMLAKDPRARFSCAADAAWALLTLPAARFPDRALRNAPTPTLPGHLPAATLTLATLSEAVAATRALQATAYLPPREQPGVALPPHPMRLPAGSPTAAYPAASTAPPLPATWRAAHTPAATLRWLGGVGVGLFRLRPTPMVGRQAERDLLWEALRSVAAHNHAGLVLVRGAAGTGKTRLANWLATRARELGVASAMNTTLKPDATSTSSLIEMIRAHLRVSGLSGEELTRRLHQSCGGGLEAQTLTRLSEILEERSALPLDAQLTTLAQVLRAQATPRPLVLVLDNLQWGAGALRLCAQLLRSEIQVPLLIVATLREEALAERDEEQALLTELLTPDDEPPRVHTIGLRALPAEDHQKLVANLLGLHHDLGRRIAERSAGNPLFAIELVGDWIQRGILHPGPRGFEIPDLALAEESLPDDLLNLGAERLRTLMQTSSIGAYHQAMEVAATLGQLVSVPLWQKVCAQTGVEAPPWLLAELMRLRLIEGSRESFAFVQGMLREALLEDARRGGRLRAFHLAAAGVLQGPGASTTLAGREQLARHLAGAGDHLLALPHYLELGDRYLVQGDLSGVRRVSALATASLHHAGLPPRSAEAVHLDLLEARVHIERRDSDAAVQRATRALEHATILNLPAARAHANELLARCNRAFNIYDKALVFFDEALALYARAGALSARASCQEGKAWTLVLLGKIPAAEALYLEAIAHLEQTQPVEVRALADCYNGLAEIRRRQQRFDDADQLLAMQEELGQRYGHISVLSDAYNTRAEIAREQGDFERARRLYETAIRFLAETGARINDIAHINLALLDLFCGEVDGAIAAFEAILERMPDDRSFAFRTYVRAALIAGYAEHQRWEDVRAQLRHFIRDQSITQIHDLDIAMCLSQGADHALRHQQHALAEPLLRLAAEQWERIDRGARAAEERARHAALAP